MRMKFEQAALIGIICLALGFAISRYVLRDPLNPATYNNGDIQGAIDSGQ